MNEELIQSLTDLGFTGMEARVYLSLLAESPQSGYGIAKKLGQPAAYVYRAVDGLEKKGALLVQLGETKLLRATPYEALINQLKGDFQSRIAQAERRLKTVQRSDWDEHIYTLTTLDQVYQRARDMIHRAESIVASDLYPAPFQQLRQHLEEASAKNVFVSAIVYNGESADIDACIESSASVRIQQWPRQWLRIAIDGTEFMNALLTKDGTDVYNAVWSANPVQSWLANYSMSMERRCHQAMNCNLDDPDLVELRGLLNEWRDPSKRLYPSGMKRFEQYFGWVDENAHPDQPNKEE